MLFLKRGITKLYLIHMQTQFELIQNLSVSGQPHPPSNISQTATLKVSCWIISLYSFTSPAILSCNKKHWIIALWWKIYLEGWYVGHFFMNPIKSNIYIILAYLHKYKGTKDATESTTCTVNCTNILSLLFCLDLNLWGNTVTSILLLHMLLTRYRVCHI